MLKVVFSILINVKKLNTYIVIKNMLYPIINQINYAI